MTETADFIDAALQYEVSPYSYPADEPDGLLRYGTSLGAIRGTLRNAESRFPGLRHDEITALASELWEQPVFERRQAAIILLQSHVALLAPNDLTRIEGFLRSAGSQALIDQLTTDVIIPMFARMDAPTRSRVGPVLERWTADPDAVLASVARRLADTR